MKKEKKELKIAFYSFLLKLFAFFCFSLILLGLKKVLKKPHKQKLRR